MEIACFVLWKSDFKLSFPAAERYRKLCSQSTSSINICYFASDIPIHSSSSASSPLNTWSASPSPSSISCAKPYSSPSLSASPHRSTSSSSSARAGSPSLAPASDSSASWPLPSPPTGHPSVRSRLPLVYRRVSLHGP